MKDSEESLKVQQQMVRELADDLSDEEEDLLRLQMLQAFSKQMKFLDNLPPVAQLSYQEWIMKNQY